MGEEKTVSLFDRLKEREERSARELKERHQDLANQLLELSGVVARRRGDGGVEGRVSRLAKGLAAERVGQESGLTVRVMLNCGLDEPLLSALSEALADEIMRLPARRRAEWEQALIHASAPPGMGGKLLACAVAAQLPAARARAQRERIASATEPGVKAPRAGRL